MAEEKYGLPVYPVLVNIFAPSPGIQIAQSFESELMGLRAIQDYRTINLWEVDVSLVFQENIASLLPFVPILKGGDSPALVQRALVQLERDEDLKELESLLAFFASLVLDTGVIQQILRWDMTVLRESSWYARMICVINDTLMLMLNVDSLNFIRVYHFSLC
ncbi:MAG: hypothetical protein AAGB01_03930 [Cyanobacteria bacterium P01_F01_bin.42]